MNYYNVINSYFDFRESENLRLFITNSFNFGSNKSVNKFLKNNIKNNIIFYSYNQYKKLNFIDIEYNIVPANVSYYIDEDIIFFIDDVDDSKINVIPPIPYKKNYIFQGWYLDKNFNIKLDYNYIFPAKVYDENGNYIFNENKIYAKWLKKE